MKNKWFYIVYLLFTLALVNAQKVIRECVTIGSFEIF
jgi:hypothetical protein